MSDSLLTVNEAAARLKLGRTKLYGLIRSGELATVSIGRSRRIPESAIMDLIARLKAAA